MALHAGIQKCGSNVAFLSWQMTGNISAFRVAPLSDFKNRVLTTLLDASNVGNYLSRYISFAGLGLSLLSGSDLLTARKITTGEFIGKAGADTTMTYVSMRMGLPGASVAAIYAGIDLFYGDNSTSGIINMKRDVNGAFDTLQTDIRRTPTVINRQIGRQRRQGPQSFLEELLNAPIPRGPNE